MTIWFDFYGLVIEVACSRAELVEEVRRDFSYFQVDERDSHVVINMHLEAPSYDGLPEVPATVLTPRNVSFLAGRTTYIDYFGRGLGVYDRDEKRCDVYTEDEHLLREIVYLFILSTAGQHLDKRGLHRLHALGLSYKGRGILLLLPSGGGKSTMALALLGEDGFFLLSEDTPLIDRKGRALPFHLPLGIRIGNDTDIPKEYLRTVRRMEFEPKTLVDLEFFKDRLVDDAVEPGLILIGQRNLGQQSKIVRISKFAAFQSLVKYMVVGLGVYQGLEFLLEKGLLDAVRNVGVGFSRLYNSVRLLFRARAYRFVLGRDHEKNRRTLIEFLKRELGDSQSVEGEPATRATS